MNAGLRDVWDSAAAAALVREAPAFFVRDVGMLWALRD
jgi:hypothetical protein